MRMRSPRIAPPVGATGINGNDADTAFLLAKFLSQLIYQRALPRARGPGQPYGQSFACVRKKLFEQFVPTGRVVFNVGNGAGERACVA